MNWKLKFKKLIFRYFSKQNQKLRLDANITKIYTKTLPSINYIGIINNLEKSNELISASKPENSIVSFNRTGIKIRGKKKNYKKLNVKKILSKKDNWRNRKFTNRRRLWNRHY